MRPWVWFCLKICLSHQLLGFLTGWARCYLNQLLLKCRFLGHTPSLLLADLICSTGWSQIKDPPASASWVLRLQVHTTMKSASFLSYSDPSDAPQCENHFPGLWIWPFQMCFSEGPDNFETWAYREENHNHGNLICLTLSSPRAHC